MTLAPNGHVTVLLLTEKPSDDLDDPKEGERDPILQLASEIFQSEIDTGSLDKDFRSELILKYIESLANLGQSHPTELQLLKIAADCGFDSGHSDFYWYDTAVPPFTLSPGDLGSTHYNGYWKKRWQVLEVFSDNGAESLVYDPKDRKHTCSWQSLPRTHPQYRTWVSDCHCESPRITIKYFEPQKRWKDVLKRAQKVSKRQRLELDDISYVKSMAFKLMIARNSSSTPPIADARLYFHRNPLARSVPHDFWGFFSTSPDPCVLSTGLEDLGWTFRYEVDYQTICVGETWERRYQKALHEGLATIPGAYPGAHVEELSDDEDLRAGEELSDDESE